MNNPSTDQPFAQQIAERRARARAHMERGALTDAYQADPAVVIRMLNEALATELLCVLRYKRHYYMATGIHAEPVAAEFQEHAAAEQAHADRLAARITQLGGEPDLNPARLADRSHTEYVEGDSLVSMVKEDLVAERIVIDAYNDMIRYLGNRDVTTRRLFETILESEEEHADDLAKILATLDPTRPS